jgi:hypothetical protein
VVLRLGHPLVARPWLRAGKTRKRKSRVRPQQHEHAEQVEVVRWLRAADITFCASANAAKRSAALAAMLKAAGMQAGFPDLMIFDAPPLAPEFIGVAIEMKRADGKGRVSDEQQGWLIALAARGWKTKVCHGAADALRFLSSLGYRVPG